MRFDIRLKSLRRGLRIFRRKAGRDNRIGLAYHFLHVALGDLHQLFAGWNIGEQVMHDGLAFTVVIRRRGEGRQLAFLQHVHDGLCPFNRRDSRKLLILLQVFRICAMSDATQLRSQQLEVIIREITKSHPFKQRFQSRIKCTFILFVQTRHEFLAFRYANRINEIKEFLG